MLLLQCKRINPALPIELKPHKIQLFSILYLVGEKKKKVKQEWFQVRAFVPEWLMNACWKGCCNILADVPLGLGDIAAGNECL